MLMLNDSTYTLFRRKNNEIKKVIEAEITYAENDSGRKKKKQERFMSQNLKSGLNNKNSPMA